MSIQQTEEGSLHATSAKFTFSQTDRLQTEE